MEERILTINDDVIAGTLESLRKASRKADALMDSYKPVLYVLWPHRRYAVQVPSFGVELSTHCIR